MSRFSRAIFAFGMLGLIPVAPVAWADVPPSDAGERRDDDGGCQAGGAGSGGAAVFALFVLATRRRRHETAK